MLSFHPSATSGKLLDLSVPQCPIYDSFGGLPWEMHEMIYGEDARHAVYARSATR